MPTDYVDVMQQHNPSVEHPTAGTGQSSDHGAEWDRLAAADSVANSLAMRESGLHD